MTQTNVQEFAVSVEELSLLCMALNRELPISCSVDPYADLSGAELSAAARVAADGLVAKDVLRRIDEDSYRVVDWAKTLLDVMLDRDRVFRAIHKDGNNLEAIFVYGQNDRYVSERVRPDGIREVWESTSPQLPSTWLQRKEEEPLPSVSVQVTRAMFDQVERLSNEHDRDSLVRLLVQLEMPASDATQLAEALDASRAIRLDVEDFGGQTEPTAPTMLIDAPNQFWLCEGFADTAQDVVTFTRMSYEAALAFVDERIVRPAA